MRALAVTLLVMLSLPSAALAAGGTNAPPGNSGVDEYLEAIPNTTGSRPATQLHQTGAATPSLSHAVAQRLNALGADGRAVAGLVAATAPKRASEQSSASEGSGKSKSTASSASAAATAGGGAPAIGKAAADTVAGGGGLGLLLPIAIGGILVAAIAARVFRRARS